MASLLDNWSIGLGFDPMGFNVVKRYDDDFNGKYEIGDLFIRESEYKGIYHAGVGYDERLIVHFMEQSKYERVRSFRNLFTFSSSSSPGPIEFVLVKDFSGGQKFEIYRKKVAIDVKEFKDIVKKRVMKEPEYDKSNINSIHFAMECLGLKVLSQ